MVEATIEMIEVATEGGKIKNNRSIPGLPDGDAQPGLNTQESAEIKGSIAEGDTEDPLDYEGRWEFFLKTDKNFFHNIAIAQDGGFSEASDLMRDGFSRYLSAFIMVFFVLMNLYFVLSVNLRLIAERDETSNDFFLVIKNYVLIPIDNLTPDSVSIAAWFPDKIIVACLELGLTAFQFLLMFWSIYGIYFSATEWQKWHAVQELFWNVIPAMSVISGLQLLGYVSPQVIGGALISEVGKIEQRGALMGSMRVLIFLIVRLVCGLVGFDILLFKLQLVTIAMGASKDPITNVTNDPFALILLSGSFLNQLLGIVQLNFFVKGRIFAFIFAGEDAFLTDAELAIKETWESFFARAIANDKGATWYQKAAMYLSYSDVDFQQMALETVDHSKQEARRKRRASRDSSGSASSKSKKEAVPLVAGSEVDN